MFINDLIGTDYQLWRGGDSIFMESPTGTGKTTFVMDVLLPYVKSQGKDLLYLSNRFLLKEQIKIKVAQNQGLPTSEDFLKDEEEFDGITILSYQKLQEKCRKKRENQYYSDRYQFVVFDEIHYILEDSAFNSEILWILDFMRKSNKTAVYISATIKAVKSAIINITYGEKVLWQTLHKVNENLQKCAVNTLIAQTCGIYSELWFYSLKQQTKIKNIKYFSDYSEVIEKIKQGNQEEKWLIFMGNKNKANQLVKEIGSHAEMICADNKDSPELEVILQKEKFSCRVLVATKVLDNGVTLKDRSLCHIVIDTISETEFLQMVGRKRFVDDTDSVTLYIPQKEVRTFSGYSAPEITETNEILEEEWSLDEIMEYMLKNEKNFNQIKRLFDWQKGTFVKNPMAQMYYENQKKFTERMSKEMQMDEWAFIKEQLKWLDKQDTFNEKNALLTDKREKIIEKIAEYLKSLISVELNLSEQNELRSRICDLAKEAKLKISSGTRKAGQLLLNRFFEDYEIPFRLKSSHPKQKGEKTIWKVEEVQ